MNPETVRFIMRIEPLKAAKLEGVVQSFESARAFTGDHNDAAAIKVSALPTEEFEKLGDQLHANWIRGDKVDQYVRSALSTGKIKEWQPDISEVLTAAYFIYPLTLGIHEGTLTNAELVYVNLKTQMVYYISFKY